LFLRSIIACNANGDKMRFKEYNANVSGLEKKLGLLGECHIYTPDESRYAAQVVSQYDTIAMEGNTKFTFMALIGRLYVPQIIAYTAATNRSLSCTTAEQHAKRSGKKIINFEDCSKLSLMQHITLALIGLASMPFAPLFYLQLKKYGDPYERGTKAYEVMRQNKEKSKKSPKMGLIKYAANLKGRDIIMADKTADIISREETSSLLVICGEGHLEGIERRLQGRFPLTETKSEELYGTFTPEQKAEYHSLHSLYLR